MYTLKSYGSMRHKEWMFRLDEIILPATEDAYSSWRNIFEGDRAYKWKRITERFSDDFQYAILRAVSVVGVHPDAWNAVFDRISDEWSPFDQLTREYMRGTLDADWRYFAEKLAFRLTYANRYFPSLRPEWLFSYGYTQRQYLADLAVYWDDIHADYSISWNIAPIGHDSPEIARLKRLAQFARSEIDSVARHSEQYLKR